MNTIRAILDTYLKKDAEGYFRSITIYTRGGNQFSGTLSQWDPMKAPNLVNITSDSGTVCFVNVADIEAVST